MTEEENKKVKRARDFLDCLLDDMEENWDWDNEEKFFVCDYLRWREMINKAYNFLNDLLLPDSEER